MNQPKDPSTVSTVGRVAVLMGGLSPERDISLDSGKNVLHALQRQGVDAYAIDVGQDAEAQLTQNKPDVAFVALHGTGGEDGAIQGILQKLGIAYTGSDVAASALAMDKEQSKWLWQHVGLPTARYVMLNGAPQWQELIERFPLPVCIKPVIEGSSLGVSKVVEFEALQVAYDLAQAYDDRVMMEPWLTGKEYTVGIVGEHLLPPIEIKTPRDFYDYEAKYVEETTEYICPCDLPAEKVQEIQRLAKQAFDVLGCRHWGRVDFKTDANGQFCIIEVNTIPGLTAHSLVPKAAQVFGMAFDALVLEICRHAQV